ncbi:EpsG family protein, partial [Citrobacter sp. Awk 4]|uniref:EpsG family protein n=1 Tax=Citrobacter sp. Awk 4 TaxID=2963955 RepID=UPI003FA4B02B
MRYKIGVDWTVYEDLFEGRGINVPFEPGYEVISNLFSALGIGFWGFVFLITSFLLYTLIVFFNKYTPLAVFCLAFYFILSFSFNIDVLRQILAVALSIWGVMSYIDCKKIRFTIIIATASSIHVSALIFFIIPFINSACFRNISIYFLFAGFVLSLINIY